MNARLIGSNAVKRAFVPGKYIGAVYTQAGAAIALYLVGRYMLPPVEGDDQTNKVSHLGFDLLRAVIVSQALTQAVKVTVRRDRPTGECCAFPSGHASATFAIAAYVAASRLHDNRHYLSDVVFGSALGIATGWTVVGRHGRSNYALLPVPVKRPGTRELPGRATCCDQGAAASWSTPTQPARSSARPNPHAGFAWSNGFTPPCCCHAAG